MKHLIASLLSFSLVFGPSSAYSKSSIIEIPYAGDLIQIDQIDSKTKLQEKIREASVMILTPEGHGSGGLF